MTPKKPDSKRPNFEHRLEKLTLDPNRAGGVVDRILAPLLRLTNYSPKLRTGRCAELVAALSAPTDQGHSIDELLDEAFDELADNLALSERACTVHGSIPIAHAAWLHRVGRLLERIDEAHQRGEAHTQRQLAEGLMLRPLVLRDTSEAGAVPEAPSRQRPVHVSAQRLLELQLAAIDHVVEAARAEQSFLERRRRLLEGARRLLLDASASLELDEVAQREREDHIAREITRIDRLEAKGLSPQVALSAQARSALRRGDRERLFAALVAIESGARAVGNKRRAECAAMALQRIGAGSRGQQGSLDEQTEQTVGTAFARHIDQALERARAHYESNRRSEDADERSTAFMALDYLKPEANAALKQALLSTDGYFEVGASLCPVRAAEVETYARLVRYPTRDMLFVLARDPADLATAAIEDPRTVLLDLAAGRLLTRRFVEQEQRTVVRRRLVGEVRVYLLDASASMHNDGVARATMRDAIMLSELATTLHRLEQADRSTRLSLYYLHFTKQLGPIHRVANGKEALAAIGDVVGTVRGGGTDIQGALEGAFEVIRNARKDDPELARASIVLVTDGEAPIDAQALESARRGTSGVAIGVSVIALGQENRVLRDLVATQRRAGQRAFYHFIDDDRLKAVAAGQLDVSSALTLKAPEVELDLHKDQLEKMLDELVEVEREEVGHVRKAAGGERSSLLAEPVEGPLALEEAAARDLVAVGKRFERWFPAPKETLPRTIDDADQVDLEATKVVLATIAEVVGELGASALHRKADAIELLERLLRDARLSPGRYDELTSRYQHALSEAMRGVHTAAQGFESWFDAKLGQQAARALNPAIKPVRRR